jgi:hypothetical protein
MRKKRNRERLRVNKIGRKRVKRGGENERMVVGKNKKGRP